MCIYRFKKMVVANDWGKAAEVAQNQVAYADVCWRMLTYAEVC